MSISNIFASPALAGMRTRVQWIVYRVAPSAKPGKLAKLPIHHATGEPCSVVDPTNWTDVFTAGTAAQARGPGHGVGYCFTEDDPYWFLDIDGAAADGAWSPLAVELCTRLDGAAVEVSASGAGLHLFGRGTLPPHASKNSDRRLELYTRGRFCAVTGTSITGDCDSDHTAAMADIVATYFQPKHTAAQEMPAEGPCPEWRGPADDVDLLRRAMRSQTAASRFGASDRASFADLWHRDVNALARSYPGDGENGVDWSSADAALAQHLAFWTGRDQARMLGLMQQSHLVREKWERSDYLPRTVASACAMQREVLQDKSTAAPTAPTPRGAPATGRRHHIMQGVPLDAARAVLERDFAHPEGDRLKAWQGMFYQWDGAKWAEMTTDDVRAMLYRFLEREAYTTYTPTQSRVSNLLDALKAAAHLDSRAAPPCWIDGRAGPSPRELLACRNGLLHLPSRTLAAPTPALFSTNAAPYDYRPDAPPPVQWVEFLRQVWPDDPESINALQEMFGYLLTPDTSQQKLFLIVGPKRSGKGTIGRVLARLLGEENVTSPALSSLGGEFGLQPLVGKLAAVVSDARLGGKADPKAIAENLLRLSGEDRVEVNRKHLASITLQLPVRFVLLTNELPRLADASGAMASRFIVLKMRQSFYGKEDPGLTGRLLAELPGILNWAIEGWHRLQHRGHFITPQSSAEEVQELADLGSPVLAFVREACELKPTGEADTAALHAAWRVWCADQGIDRVSTRQQFGHDLGHAVDGLTQHQRGRDEGRARFYRGIQLRTDWHGLARVAMHCSPGTLRAA